MGMIKCSNCGATFDEKEPKCPYCGMIYVPGAEKEYNKKLENIRVKLDNVDEEAEESVKGDLRAFFKTFLFVFLFVFAIGMCFAISRYVTNKGGSTLNRVEAVKLMEELQRFKSYEAQWNTLFDEEKYDEMYELYIEQSMDVKTFRSYWVHYKFYDQYGVYRNFEDSVAHYVDNPGYSSYYASVLSYLMTYHYNLFDRTYASFTSEEEKIFTDMWDGMKEEAVSALGLSEKELDDFIAANSGGYPSYSNCSDFAKERVEK